MYILKHHGSSSSSTSKKKKEEAEVKDRVEAEDKDEPNEMMSGDGSLQSGCPPKWIDDLEEGEAVDGDGVGKGGGRGDSSDEAPQPSTSTSVRASRPKKKKHLPPNKDLFVMRRINPESHSLSEVTGDPV